MSHKASFTAAASINFVCGRECLPENWPLTDQCHTLSGHSSSRLRVSSCTSRRIFVHNAGSRCQSFQRSKGIVNFRGGKQFRQCSKGTLETNPDFCHPRREWGRDAAVFRSGRNCLPICGTFYFCLHHRGDFFAPGTGKRPGRQCGMRRAVRRHVRHVKCGPAWIQPPSAPTAASRSARAADTSSLGTSGKGRCLGRRRQVADGTRTSCPLPSLDERDQGIEKPWSSVRHPFYLGMAGWDQVSTRAGGGLCPQHRYPATVNHGPDGGHRTGSVGDVLRRRLSRRTV